MKRITGTHVYTYPKCGRAVALDFHGDRELRRENTEVEEFVLRRGRELEDRLTADLGYETPEYPERDFDAGAAATLELLRAGVAGVLQGVVLGEDRLGIPDLLRREDGASDLGEYHYVVGDIKSSRAARGDQILQTMFYSRLLARLQGREPSYAYLVLRDGHEERFAVRDYAAAIDEVEERIVALRADAACERPFYGPACAGCRWSPVCLPELEGRADLSLLQGMTRGLREALERAGLSDVDAVRTMPIEPTARRTRLESALLRRIKRAAEARATGRPVPEKRAAPPPGDKAVVHLLADPFADRVHYFGVLFPARDDGRIFEAFPRSREQELPALLGLIEKLPRRVPVWHYGQALPRWYDEVAWSRRQSLDLESRLVDLAKRLRGAAGYPGPVFGLEGHVRHGLGLDPNRAGEAGAVGMWAEMGDDEARLRAKGRSDLSDLAALIAQLVEGSGGGSDARAEAAAFSEP